MGGKRPHLTRQTSCERVAILLAIACGMTALALAVIHVFVVRVILVIFYTLPTDAIYPPLSTLQMLLLSVFDIGFIIAMCMLIDRWKASHISPNPSV